MKRTAESPYLLLAMITILMWSSAFAGIGAALSAYPPAHLALFRFLVASIVLGVYASLTRMRMPERRDVPLILLLGFLGITVYHLALSYGQLTVAAGSASLLISSSPVFIALLARFFLQENLNHWGWLGIGLSFFGVMLLSLGEGGGFRLETGAFLVLLAAVSTSLYFVFQKPLLKRYRGIELTTYVIWSGTFFMFPFLGGISETLRNAPFSATAAVVYLGVFPAALAYVAWTHAFAYLPASRLASFLYLSPVLAILIAWVWLGEIPTYLSLLGGAVALVGAIVVNILGRLPEEKGEKNGGKK